MQIICIVRHGAINGNTKVKTFMSVVLVYQTARDISIIYLIVWLLPKPSLAVHKALNPSLL